MCQAFAKNGHEVVLLTPDYPDVEPEVADLYHFYGVDTCFKIKKLPWFACKGRARIYGFLAALEAKRLQPNLVYGRCLQSCFLGHILGLPIVYESHTLPTNAGRITAWMLSRLIRSKCLKRFVVTSHTLRQDYQERYRIPESLITVAYNGADEPGKCEKLELADANRFQVGYVGHLYPGKGMEVVSALATTCSWADFHVIGGSESDIKYWKNQLAGLSNIFFHGYILCPQTEQYRQCCDVLIAPYQRRVSVTDKDEESGSRAEESGRWMTPIKIFEYMASGKAIISSDLPVAREVLTHGFTALLYEPEDINNWIRGLTDLRDNPGVRELLGMRASEEFQAKYTWKARSTRVLRGVNQWQC